MSLESPLFSIVIPAYNAERFLGLTLQSIFAQTVQDFEIVVVNDGSNDGTLNLLEQVQDPRLRIITRENGGECAARNQGMMLARGKYVAFLDSDDVWCTNHLEQSCRFLDTHQEYMWYSSSYKKTADITETDIKYTGPNRGKVEAVNWYLAGAPRILPSCVTVRREQVQQFPDLFQVGFKMFGDSLGWSKFAKRYPMIAISDKETVLYRYWQGNACTTYNVFNRGRRTEAVKMALDKHAEFYAEPDCPQEAKLYFQQFALANWWACITSAVLPEEWRQDWETRKGVVGAAPTLWMRFCAFANTATIRAMRWGVRRVQLRVEKQMARLAALTRQEYRD